MRRRYLVHGEVQGVGFRYFAWRLATRLGLTGWVRNLPDGSVEALADGDPVDLTRFEAELRRGPPMASVTSVQSGQTPSENERFDSFEIQ